MKKSIVAIAAVLAMMVAVAAPAAAQAASLSVSPGSVDAAGEAELTVTGSDFTSDGFLLPCPGADGDPAKMGADSCDTAALTPYTVDESGGWSATVTYDIPAEGLVIVAGNADQTESAVSVIAVGAGTLPNTGANTNALVLMTLGLIGAGAVLFTGGRRLQRG